MASGCGTSGDGADAKMQNGGGGVGSSDVEPSSSEQSADTVIYVGPSEETDGEHPPVHIPSLSSVVSAAAPENRTCHPLNKLLGQQAGGSSRSTPSSPQRSSSLAAGGRTAVGCRPNGTNSARSSPVRTPKTGAAAAAAGCGNGRQREQQRPEERWIDGPRISKSRARAMLMGAKDDGKTKAGETWIDGPMHGHATAPAVASGGQHANVYGFMDYHKKNMIKKWVEHQVYQVRAILKGVFFFFYTPVDVVASNRVNFKFNVYIKYRFQTLFDDSSQGGCIPVCFCG